MELMLIYRYLGYYTRVVGKVVNENMSIVKKRLVHGRGFEIVSKNGLSYNRASVTMAIIELIVHNIQCLICKSGGA